MAQTEPVAGSPGEAAGARNTLVPRWATGDDAAVVAQLLHDFNTEFDVDTPGTAVLAPRLRTLLGTESTAAILAGRPGVAVAVLTYRPNVWFDGEVALLDELYVVPERRGQGVGSAIIELLLRDASSRGVGLLEVNVDEADVDAQRFYARHGFHMTEPGSDERAFYHWREP